jgi:hypothetical protein
LDQQRNPANILRALVRNSKVVSAIWKEPNWRPFWLASTSKGEGFSFFPIEPFGPALTEPAEEGKSYCVFLSDGTLSMAILRFGWDQGPGLDYRGVNHLGILVDDVERYVDKLEKPGAKCFARRPEGRQGFYETKFHGPDKVIFDITDQP